MADVKIVRLRNAAGAVVRVSEEEAKTLGRGFVPAPEKKPARRVASVKK